MKIHYLFTALLLAGCASPNPPTSLNVSPGPLPQKHDLSDPASVRTPEQLKAYPVGRYEDPNDPEVMHEGHTIYRAETSPDWNTDPNEPTSLPLGPGEMAAANPAQQHTALTAELEQRLKQEDQLLQSTYEQNERLAQEIQTLQVDQQHLLLPVPPAQPSVEAPQPAAPITPPPQTAEVVPSSQPTKTWWQWFRSLGSIPTPPQSNPKGN
jgi:hypothetical protein